MTLPGAQPPRPVRVAFFGNVVNALFEIVRALREHPDMDAQLFVSGSESMLSRPESADATLASAYPPWIHEGDWITPASVLAPWRAEVTRRLAEFDIIVVSGPGPIFAQWTGRPWCWFVTGGDLTVKPFPFTFLSWYDGWERKAGEVVGGAWQRRAARRADRIWAQPFAPMTEALARLRVPPEIVSSRYLPLVVDTGEFTPEHTITAPDDPVVRRMLESDLAVLHPSRLVIEANERLRRAGQWKGNDVLIRGFAKLVATGEIDRPVLVIPDIGLSRDVAVGKALVDELGIGDHVLWARPPEEQGFPRFRMLDLYAAADVVGSDFGVGWFGFVTLEGLAMATPVVSHVDAAVMAQLYPEGNPICEAADPDQVCGWLRRLRRGSAEAARIGEESRRWLVAHHSPAVVSERYREALDEVVRYLGLART